MAASDDGQAGARARAIGVGCGVPPPPREAGGGEDEGSRSRKNTNQGPEVSPGWQERAEALRKLIRECQHGRLKEDLEGNVRCAECSLLLDLVVTGEPLSAPAPSRSRTCPKPGHLHMRTDCLDPPPEPGPDFEDYRARTAARLLLEGFGDDRRGGAE